jgi:hypothetical protein
MKYGLALLIVAGVATIGYFSLGKEHLVDSTASSTDSGAVVSDSSAEAQQQSAAFNTANKKVQLVTSQLAATNSASTVTNQSSSTELAADDEPSDLSQQAQRFAADALANGYFSVDEVDAMLLSDNFDELSDYLSYQHDDDIQVRLDVEQQLANVFTDGAVVNNINCGGFICLLSIDAGNNDDIESVVNAAIRSDNKIKTVVYRSVVTNGQEQLRAVFSYHDKINAVMVTQKTGS